MCANWIEFEKYTNLNLKQENSSLILKNISWKMNFTKEVFDIPVPS